MYLRKNKLVSSSIFHDNCITCRLCKSHHIPFLVCWTQFYFSYTISTFWGLIIFHYSHFTWFYPMKRKNEVFSIFTKFKAMVQNQFGHLIKIFQSNGGGEFDNSPMQNLFLQSGILFWNLVLTFILKML